MKSATEYGFDLWRAVAALIEALAAAHVTGNGADLERCEDALSAWRATGSGVFLPASLALLAERYLELEPLYRSFSEDLETPDLVEAGRLLREL